MLSRLQRFVILGVVVLIAGWAVVCIKLGLPRWSGFVSAVLVGGYCSALATEFLWLHRSYLRTDAHRPTVSDLFKACLLEIAGAPLVFLWRQPFRSRSFPDQLETAVVGRRGIVFVHGYVCNRGIWNGWMARMRPADVPFVAVDLEPVFGSIDAYAAIVDGAVQRVREATGLAPIVIAHSMGGLAVRRWLTTRGGADEPFHSIVTIATPHRGTWMARFARSINGSQMCEGGPWLAALEAGEDAASWRRFICYWSRCDNIVFPTTNGTLPGADNRHLPVTPHVRMIDHPDIFDAVMKMLQVSTSLEARR